MGSQCWNMDWNTPRPHREQLLGGNPNSVPSYQYRTYPVRPPFASYQESHQLPQQQQEQLGFQHQQKQYNSQEQQQWHQSQHRMEKQHTWHQQSYIGHQQQQANHQHHHQGHQRSEKQTPQQSNQELQQKQRKQRQQHKQHQCQRQRLQGQQQQQSLQEQIQRQQCQQQRQTLQLQQQPHQKKHVQQQQPQQQHFHQEFQEQQQMEMLQEHQNTGVLQQQGHKRQEEQDVFQKQEQLKVTQDQNDNPQEQQESQAELQQQQNSIEQKVFTKKQTNALRHLLAFDQVCSPTMKEIFEFGAKEKRPGETVKDFLLRTNLMTVTSYKKVFNRTHRYIIEKDPSCETFDVSLWFLVIQRGCSNLEDYSDANTWGQSPETLEYHLKQIKDCRNAAMHLELSVEDDDLYNLLEEIRDLLIKTLELAQAKYSVQIDCVTAAKKKVNSNINNIRDSPLTKFDLTSYENLPLFRALQGILENVGISELEKIFKERSHVNPASLIAGHEIRLKVDHVYTALEIIHGGRYQGYEAVDHTNFLEYALSVQKSKDARIQILLIEGIAGVGKTTLIKMLFSDWLSGRKTGKYIVEKLEDFKFIIPVECRNTRDSSLGSIISSLMPTARKRFQKERDMMDCLLDLPSLIVVDGLDELNPISKKVLMEILELRNLENVTVICTTRPEKVQDYYRMLPDDVSTVHVKILGIPELSREVFVEKYHDELRAKGISKQDTLGLLDYLRTTGARLQEHWKLPLNLSLLPLLWAVDPSRVNNITTPIELLQQIHELTVEKLLARLAKNHASCHLSYAECKKKVSFYLKALCREAMLGIRDDAMLLSGEAETRLMNICVALNLPSEELLGAFLIQKNSWTAMGVMCHVTFTHKAMQEFYGSRHLYAEVYGKFEESNIDIIIMLFQQVLSAYNVPSTTQHTIMSTSSKALVEGNKDTSEENVTFTEVLDRLHAEESVQLTLEKYQNTFIMLMGHLYRNKKVTKNETVAIELIKLLKESGIDGRERWVTVLQSADCNNTIARLIGEVPGLMDGSVQILEPSVFAYSKLFRTAKPKRVGVKIFGNPSVVPNMAEVLSTIAEECCEVEMLWMNKLMRRPLGKCHLTDVITQIMARCRVGDYRGEFTPNMRINEESNLTQIWVSTPDTESYKRFQEHIRVKKGNLDYLGVSIHLSVDPEVLQPLPGINGLALFLPEVSADNIPRAVDFIRRLHPVTEEKRYGRLCFPRFGLTLEETMRFLKLLEGVICWESVRLPSGCCPPEKEEELKLQKFTEQMLQASNAIVWGTRGGGEGGTFDMDSW